jgi:hypothetical protein
MSFNFGEVLTRAWQITWKYKVLWIFGIFASCGTRSGGNYGNNFNYETRGESPNLPPGFEQNLERALRFFENPAVIAGLLSIICILFVLTILLSTIGRIGLIQGTRQAEAGAESLTFGGLWTASLSYFWRIFGLSVLVGLPAFVLFLLIFVGIFLSILAVAGSENSNNPAWLALLPVLCVLFLVVLAVSFVLGLIALMASNAIVIENESILGGLRRGWNVIIKNLGPFLIMFVLLLVIGGVAGILIALPVIAVVFPAVFSFALSDASGRQPSFTPLIIAGLCLVAYFPISLVANGILGTYTGSAWTLTYLRLTKPKEETPAALPPNA